MTIGIGRRPEFVPRFDLCHKRNCKRWYWKTERGQKYCEFHNIKAREGKREQTKRH